MVVQDAVAEPPVAFGGFTDTGGTITAPCPATFECIVGVNDVGILQRTLRAANGDEFTQLIITGTDSRGTTMVDESFIRMNSALSGISLQQTIFDAAGGVDQLNARTVLNTGWANTAGPAIDITQSLISGAEYSDTFAYSVDLDANGNVLGTYTDISQTLTNSTAAFSNLTPPTGADVQKFVARRASGTRNPSAGSASLGRGMGGGGMDGGGGTINWNVGDDLQIVWIGMRCEGCGDGGGGMGGGGMGGGTFNVTFSYEMIDNLSDTISPIMTASIISTNPFVWPDPPFGVAPTGP